MDPSQKSSFSFLLAIAVFAAFTAVRDGNARPNLIFIMSDDQGYWEAGVNERTELLTPNLDKMAEDGLKFTQFYTGTPLCGPTRCNLMTAMHNGHCRLRSNDVTYLRDEDVTVGEVLQFAGYKTGAFGKWGLSWDTFHQGKYEPESFPTRQGFDRFYGYRDQVHAHNFYPEFLISDEDTAALRNVRMASSATAAANSGAGDRGQGNATPEGEVEHSHTLITEELFNFIRAHKDTSFFAYVPYTIPHINNEGISPDGGFEVPDLGAYAGKDWPLSKKSYAALITMMDTDIGRLRDLLAELGIERNTLVIFTADNGPAYFNGLGDTVKIGHWFKGDDPYQGLKSDVYEGGIRMPTFAVWPGVIGPGRVTDHIGYFPDVMPTFAELAGVSVPTNIDGISFAATLLGDSAGQTQHEFVYWQLGQKKAVRSGPWKLVSISGTTALYNIDDDPGEEVDLQSFNAGIYDDLLAKMNASSTGVVVAEWTPALLAPAILSGCMDTTYLEYDFNANHHDPVQCVNLIPISVKITASPAFNLIFNDDRASFSVQSLTQHHITVHNTSGETILEFSGQGQKEYFLLESSLPGVYVIKAGTGGTGITRKITLF